MSEWLLRRGSTRACSLGVDAPRRDYPGTVILGIDTSLGTAVAVIEVDGVVRGERASADPRGHAEVIGGLLATVLADAGVEASAITHVAAGMGPGPFTGLRVGIAAARTFALGRGVPVVPVPSHDAAALGILLAEAILSGADADAEATRFAVVTDARRREFAYSVYEGLDDDGLPVRVAGPALAPRDDVDTVVRELGAEPRVVTDIPASMVALVAARAVAAGREVASAEALYLRAPDVTMPTGPKKVGV